ncbi:MAG: NAD(P)H-dependent flavin oxidoreductase [Candidatus Thorarchaeota archaeon]|jgi:NAD(P)H-dependent flavin oxidoreductase YrpB (nitropropane dioxygenase family)
MTSLHTEICDILGIKHPILQGGMGPYKTEDLAIAVTNAGALGVISCIGMAATLLPEAAPVDAIRLFGTDPPPIILQKSIEAVTKGTQKSGGVFGVNIPVAAEFLLASEMFARGVVEAREGDSDIERSLRVIVTSAGNPTPWAQLKKQGLIWAHVVPSVYHAKKAEKAGADIIVASGHEGGAHVSWDPVHSMVLVPAVAKAVKTPVVAAGGFCDGNTLAAALSLGAKGIQMGTRFIATQESDFEPIWKQAIIGREERQTLVGRGLFGPMRFVRNKRAERIVEQTLEDVPRFYLGEPLDSNEAILKLERDGFDDLIDAKAETALMFGGEVVGRIDDMPTVQSLVNEIISDAAKVIQSLPDQVITK